MTMRPKSKSRTSAEVALRSTDATVHTDRLEAVVASLPEALIVTDRIGRILSFNAKARAMFDYDDREIVGTPIAKLLGQEGTARNDWFACIENCGQCQLADKCDEIKFGPVATAQRRNGTSFPVALSLGYAGDGERLFFVRDLTERQQAELRLHELQIELARVSGMAAVGTIATTFAHQLNPPLTATVNYLEGVQAMLNSARPDISAACVGLADAAAEAYRAGEIVQRLRDAVTWSGPAHRVENLPQLMEEASGLALLSCGDRGIEVHVSIDKNAKKVIADGIQVQQVLLNLIRNAMEAMEHSSSRELMIRSTRESGGYVKLTVADSGPGIGDEVSAHLFQPFTTSKADGMGLGLSVCREIVEAHGGRIWTEPSSLGGTAFHFTLVDGDPPGDQHS